MRPLAAISIGLAAACAATPPAPSDFALDPLEIPVEGLQEASVERELVALYQEDLEDRELLARDAVEGRRRCAANDPRRRARVDALWEAGRLVSPTARTLAAYVYHHGEGERDASRAYTLARRAAEEGSLHARWLACAAEDRALLRSGRPQRWGTQDAARDDGSYALAPVDGTVSDAQRARWGVEPLAQAKARSRPDTAPATP